MGLQAQMVKRLAKPLQNGCQMRHRNLLRAASICRTQDVQIFQDDETWHTLHCLCKLPSQSNFQTWVTTLLSIAFTPLSPCQLN